MVDLTDAELDALEKSAGKFPMGLMQRDVFLRLITEVRRRRRLDPGVAILWSADDENGSWCAPGATDAPKGQGDE